MATAKRELTDPRVQGQPLDSLDKMIAIAVRIAEREGLLLDGADQAAPVTDPAHRNDEAQEQDRCTA